MLGDADVELIDKVLTDEEQTQVAQGAEVKIYLEVEDIPEELRNSDPTVTRSYQIIRVHEAADGSLVTEVIEGIFNAEDNSFSFETDKFSTYALVYSDDSTATYLLGDVNMDGSVDSMDTNILFRYANGDATLGELSAEQLIAGDANQDGSVDSMDTNILFRYANGDATLNWTPAEIQIGKTKDE